MNKNTLTYPYRILVVDNVAEMAEATRDRLESAGYYVEIATTLDDADDLMHERYFHVAVLDIRMMGDDPNDWTGIELAERCRYPETKVMFSSFFGEEPEYASRVLRIDDQGRAIARELVNKNYIDDPEKGVLAKLADVIARHVRINHALYIHKPLGWSFLAAAELIAPAASPQKIIDYAQQLEDLFRRHFYDERQITLYPLPVWADGRVWLYVETFDDSGNVCRFIVACGFREIISRERDQHHEFARSSRWQRHVSYRETLHCALSAYHLVEHLAEPRSWSQHPLDQWPVDLLKYLPDALIRMGPQPAELVESDLLSVALGQPELADKLPNLAQIINRIATSCHHHFPERVSLKSDETFVFNHLPNVPFAAIGRAAPVLLCHQATQRPMAPVHGALDTDHLLHFAGSDGLAVIDYSDVRQASVLHDYVALDWSLRLEITRYLPLDECFAAMLYVFGKGQLLDDNPAMRDAVESVHAVRLFAQDTLGDIAYDDVAYTSELMAHGVRYLLQYPKDLPRLTPTETACYAQALFITLLACERLLPLEALCQPLWLDSDGEFWSFTGIIDLTDTSHNILKLLYENAGQLVSYEQLFRQGLKANTYDSNTDLRSLHTAISRLRAQLKGIPARIETQRGEAGYVLTFEV